MHNITPFLCWNAQRKTDFILSNISVQESSISFCGILGGNAMVSRWTIPATRRNLIPKFTPVYNDQRLSKCASCQRMFTNKDDLRHHILLSHTGSKPHACSICGRRYGQVHQLNSHFKLHREPRLQASDLCSLFSRIMHSL